MVKMLSRTERTYITARSGLKGPRFGPQQLSNMKRNILKKLDQSILDLVLLCKERKTLQNWIHHNVPTWNEFVQSLYEAQFDIRYGPVYAFKYRSGRNSKGQIIYWVDDLRGTKSREYLNALRLGDEWSPAFPFKGLGQAASRMINDALSLGIQIPQHKQHAIARVDLKRMIADSKEKVRRRTYRQ